MGQMNLEPLGVQGSGTDRRYASMGMNYVCCNQSARILLGSKGGIRRCVKRELICGHRKAWHRFLVSAAKEETVSQTEKFLESLEKEEENAVGGHDLEQQQQEVSLFSFAFLITLHLCNHTVIFLPE